ncbi:MAG: hypothetical protein ABI629_17415 [bacterium]
MTHIVKFAFAAIIALAAQRAAAADAIPPDFRGEWVPATADCTSPQRLKVSETQLTLINGRDSQSYGGIGIPTTFFGPDYTGISVVAMPEVDSGNSPFTVYFNNDDKKGETKVEIYIEMKGPQNAQMKAIQDAAKKLAARFPALNLNPLKKCS